MRGRRGSEVNQTSAGFDRGILFKISLLAAAALMFESTLTRFLAVAQYYHFAFLVVSLALLGFGASGSILHLRAVRRWSAQAIEANLASRRLMLLSGTGFSGSVIFAYGIVNLLPFDSYRVAWDYRQVVLFALYYLSLTVPFLFVGLGIGGALIIFSEQNQRIYASNLAGSAAGVLTAPVVMWAAGVPGAVLGAILLGLTAGVLRSRSLPSAWRLVHSLVILAGIGLLTHLTIANLANRAPLGMTLSPYKGLSAAMRIPGARVIFSRWNALSRIDVVSGGSIRMMPGLSYIFPENPPEQLGLAFDADSVQPLTLIQPDQFEAAGYLPETIAFLLRPEAKSLVLEPGGGLGVLQALAAGADSVTVVIDNPLVFDAVSETAGGLNVFQDGRVTQINSSAREFLGKKDKTFDVIFLPLTESYKPVASGAYSLIETYLYTVEGLESVLEKLSENGIFVSTRWLQTPPSEEIKFMSTALEALKNQGTSRFSDEIIAFRGLQTMTFLLQPDGWQSKEVAEVRRFCETRKYDLVWAPDITEEDVNRFNLLPEPVYYEVINELMKTPDREAFYDSYSYNIEPPHDDRPFFFHFFKWEQTPQLLAAIGHVWQPFGGSGYFVLIALLILVLCLSLLMIGIPYLVGIRSSTTDNEIRKWFQSGPHIWRELYVFMYFSSIGVAFMLIEIPLIQRSILLLGHSIYAFTIVVFVLLSASSLGSLLSGSPRFEPRRAMAALTVCALITVTASKEFLQYAVGWSFFTKAAVLSVFLMPIGVLMGVPFPSGMKLLAGEDDRLIAWAWAINGCASVIASVVAALLALSSGFSLVMFLGAGSYLLATIIILLADRRRAYLNVPR